MDQPAPRPVRLSAEGRRELAVTAATATAGAATASLFLSTPHRPLWLDALFIAFAVVGAAWVYRIAVVWISRFQLVRGGAPAWGVVVAREPSAKGVRFVVWYSAAGREWSVEGPGEASAAEIGDAMTVLHLAEAPEQSLIYRFARFRAAAPPELADAPADDTARPRRVP